MQMHHARVQQLGTKATNTYRAWLSLPKVQARPLPLPGPVTNSEISMHCRHVKFVFIKYHKNMRILKTKSANLNC